MKQEIDPIILQHGDWGPCGHNLHWSVKNTWERDGHCLLCWVSYLEKIVLVADRLYDATAMSDLRNSDEAAAYHSVRWPDGRRP